MRNVRSKACSLAVLVVASCGSAEEAKGPYPYSPAFVDLHHQLWVFPFDAGAYTVPLPFTLSYVAYPADARSLYGVGAPMEQRPRGLLREPQRAPYTERRGGYVHGARRGSTRRAPRVTSARPWRAPPTVWRPKSQRPPVPLHTARGEPPPRAPRRPRRSRVRDATGEQTPTRGGCTNGSRTPRPRLLARGRRAA